MRVAFNAPITTIVIPFFNLFALKWVHLENISQGNIALNAKKSKCSCYSGIETQPQNQHPQSTILIRIHSINN